MSQHNFEDESMAPAVDEFLLKALVRRELTPDEARGAFELIYAFESWNAAYTRILIAELREKNRSEDDEAAD